MTTVPGSRPEIFLCMFTKNLYMKNSLFKIRSSKMTLTKVVFLHFSMFSLYNSPCAFLPWWFYTEVFRSDLPSPPLVPSLKNFTSVQSAWCNIFNTSWNTIDNDGIPIPCWKNATSFVRNKRARHMIFSVFDVKSQNYLHVNIYVYIMAYLFIYL